MSKITNEAALLWLAAQEQRRESSGLNALMEKFTSARAAGLDLNEADKTRLLALLLDERLRGIGNYPERKNENLERADKRAAKRRSRS